MWAKASFTLRLSSAIDLPLCLSRSPKRSFCSFSGRVEIACFIFFFGGGGGGDFFFLGGGGEEEEGGAFGVRSAGVETETWGGADSRWRC